MNILIVGDEIEFDVTTSNYDGSEVSSGSREWLVFADPEDAGKRARDYWADMAKNDKREFRAIVGDERISLWGIGESDEYGFSSLDDFLDSVESHPADDLARYDGEERDGYVNKPLLDDLSLGGEGEFKLKFLREALAAREVDVDLLPEDIRDTADDFAAEEDEVCWTVLRERFRRDLLAGEEWATDLRDIFTFYPVVCYRTN